MKSNHLRKSPPQVNQKDVSTLQDIFSQHLENAAVSNKEFVHNRSSVNGKFREDIFQKDSDSSHISSRKLTERSSHNHSTMSEESLRSHQTELVSQNVSSNNNYHKNDDFERSLSTLSHKNHSTMSEESLHNHYTLNKSKATSQSVHSINNLENVEPSLRRSLRKSVQNMAQTSMHEESVGNYQNLNKSKVTPQNGSSNDIQENEDFDQVLRRSPRKLRKSVAFNRSTMSEKSLQNHKLNRLGNITPNASTNNNLHEDSGRKSVRRSPRKSSSTRRSSISPGVSAVEYSDMKGSFVSIPFEGSDKSDFSVDEQDISKKNTTLQKKILSNKKKSTLSLTDGNISGVFPVNETHVQVSIYLGKIFLKSGGDGIRIFLLCYLHSNVAEGVKLKLLYITCVEMFWK